MGTKAGTPERTVSMRIPTPTGVGPRTRGALSQAVGALAPGAFDHPDKRLTRQAARALFLELLSEEHPSVLAELTGPAKAFGWAKRYGLAANPDAWIVRWAERIAVTPPVGNRVPYREHEATVPDYDQIAADYDRTHPGHPVQPIDARPFEETLQSFLQRAQAHWNARARAMTAAGFVPLQEPRRDRATFSYLLGAYVGGARLAALPASTQASVRSLAKLIDLPPRRPGRPTTR